MSLTKNLCTARMFLHGTPFSGTMDSPQFRHEPVTEGMFPIETHDGGNVCVWCGCFYAPIHEIELLDS